MTPANATGPLPILFRRTPYGVPENADVARRPIAEGLERDGYIFVVQNLRGRFGSEGTFELSSKADLENPKATSETTDAYDTIDWLVKNVAEQQRQGRHVRRLLRRPHLGDDAAAPAPGAEGDLRTGVARPISG